MSDINQAVLKSNLEALLALAPAQWQAAIAALDATPEEKAELASLLLHARETQTAAPALQQAQAALEQAEASDSVAQGDQIGPWKLLELIGKGGMGEVFLAERNDGAFRGRAAIKCLSVGVRHAHALLRFRQEQHALAQLDHLNIARLFDAGLDSESRPYFVMEWVDGVPLDNFVENLDFKARIRIFLQLCDAVAYAHRKLIVHRDLKPSNVLVRRDGVLKLLDFGIAKALDVDAQPALATQPEQRFFTPRYATPEQVQGLPVSTATDVYALGLILYELLTGQMPYGQNTTFPSELAFAAVQTEPTPPSKLAQSPLGALWPQFRKLIRGDLETIILKALEKAPEARYSSVDALAADLQNVLAHRPILAIAPSKWVAAKKFVRRNLALCTAAAISLASILGGASWAFIAAQQEARQRVIAVRKSEESQAVTQFLDRLLTAIDPAQAKGKTPTVLGVIEPALKANYQMPADPAVAARVDITLGRAMLALDRADDALMLSKRANAALARIAEPDAELRASSELFALQAQWQSVQHVNKLTPEAFLAQFDSPALVNPYLSASEKTQAELFRAHILQMQLQIEPSLAQFEATLARLEKQGDQQALDAAARAYLSVVVKWRKAGLKHIPLAQQLLQSALAQKGDIHPDVSGAYSRLGVLYMGMHQYSPAIIALEKSLAVDLQLYKPEHIELLYSRVALGVALIKANRENEALAPLQLAFDAHKNSDVGYYAQGWLATAQWQAGLIAEAERNFLEIINSGREKDAWTMIPARHRYGLLLLARGELAAAEKLLERAAADAPVAYGADNPSLLEMTAERAKLWLAQGKPERVLQELPSVITSLQAVYGMDAPPIKKAQALLLEAQQIAKGKNAP